MSILERWDCRVMEIKSKNDVSVMIQGTVPRRVRAVLQESSVGLEVRLKPNHGNSKTRQRANKDNDGWQRSQQWKRRTIATGNNKEDDR